MATVLVNPLPKILGKFSKFHEFTGSLIHYFRLISNLSDSASSDTMTLARASSKTFIPDSGSVTTVTSNNAAFTGSGVLIEPSHTNKLTYSSQLDNAAWTKSGAGCSVTANAGTAPDGTTTADRINAGTSGSGNIQQVLTVTGTSTCGFGAFVKAGSVNYVTLRTFDTGFAYGQTSIHVNLTNGSIVTSASVGAYSIVDQNVIDCGSGWYYIYQTVSGVDRNTLMMLYPANSTTPFTNASGNNILAWNLQGFEDAVGNLSPVETTTAAATSLKDDYTMALDEIPDNDFYIQLDWKPLSDTTGVLISFEDAGGGVAITYTESTSTLSVVTQAGNVSITSFNPVVDTSYTIKLTKTSAAGLEIDAGALGSNTNASATGNITFPATGYVGSAYTGSNHSHSVIANVKVGDA